MNKFVKISEASKILNLIDPITKKPLNHILRYWEKEFNEVKPKKINNHRYYSQKQIETIKIIKFLLKSKGMTISGVKKFMKLNINKLDGNAHRSLNDVYYKNNLKEKSKLVLEKLKKVKSYGKKKLISKLEWFLKVIRIVNLYTMQKNRLKVKRPRINLN